MSYLMYALCFMSGIGGATVLALHSHEYLAVFMLIMTGSLSLRVENKGKGSLET
jgi:hypothetical protein